MATAKKPKQVEEPKTEQLPGVTEAAKLYFQDTKLVFKSANPKVVIPAFIAGALWNSTKK